MEKYLKKYFDNLKGENKKVKKYYDFAKVVFEGFLKEHVLNKKPSNNPKAYFIGGLPGVGKNYFLFSKMKIGEKNLVIDPDYFKPFLVEKLRKKYKFFFSKDIHLLSGILACATRDICLNNKISYNLISTLIPYNNAEIELTKAKNAGFNIEVEFLLGDLYESYLNAFHRYLKDVESIFKNRKNNNFFSRRFVSFNYIKNKNEKMIESITKINQLIEEINKEGQKADFFIYGKESNESINLMLYNAEKDNYYINPNTLQIDRKKDFYLYLNDYFNFLSNKVDELEKRLQKYFKNKNSYLNIQKEDLEVTKEIFLKEAKEKYPFADFSVNRSGAGERLKALKI